MACSPEVLRDIPLFSNLDDDELRILAGQVELRRFPPRQRIFRTGDPADRAYIVVSGCVRVILIDEDHQEILLHQPGPGEYFGFASMLEQTPHQAEATATEDTTCIEIDHNDLMVLFQQKPHSIIDILAFLGRQLHDAHQIARNRSMRPPDDIIEEQYTFGERIADVVASFGGSWTFIITFGLFMATYVTINIALAMKAWDPYPFILLNLFLSALAAIQAPVIMMSQNRQDKKDRLRSELDFEVNRHARTELQGVAQKLNNVGDRIADIEELLRAKII
jgi:CRP/FNR family transcriptional regulator, cyclic AMP receptor protein